MKFVFDGRRASFLLDGIPAWTIAPSCFSGRPRLSVREGSRSIVLRLRDARYPGSSVPADLRCTVTKGRLYWTIDLRLDFGGFRSSGEIEPWLAGEQALSSRVEWQGSLLASRPLKLGVALDGSAQARFSPDWTLALERPVGASVSLAGGLLPAGRLEVRLPEPGQPSLAVKQLKKRSAIIAERGHHVWPKLVETGSLRGGELEVDEQAFSRFEIESHDGVEGRHVFYLATSQARREVARIRPGADYRLPGGDPLALPLRDLRLAGFAGPHGSERAFLASQAGDPLWLDAGSTRLKLGGSEDGSVLEILESSGGAPRFLLAPALLATLTPIEGAIALETPPAAPTRIALAARDGDAPAGENCGFCSERADGALEVRLPGHSISVLRPEDLLVVRFELVNLEVRKSCFFEKPHLAVKDRCQDAFLIVHLPPQSIAERAFLEAPVGSEEPRIGDMQSRLSGESRLAFVLKDRAVEIPYTLSALLRWNSEVWQPAKVPATRPVAEINRPADRETDIEFPWRLHLSPDDRTVWSHSLEPVTREGRTELWHTRLTLERPWETEWPTVRAVWADCDPPTQKPVEAPFRMSLSGGQRCQIVLATHEKRPGPPPDPVDAHLFALSALGAWSDLRGDWPCIPATACNSLARWDHLATMGRDQKVIIESRGFLMPTGHKATLVQETVRELHPVKVTIDGRERRMFIAFLRQRCYVKIKEPVRTYGNWDQPHRAVEILDKRTPILNDPHSQAGGCVHGCGPSQTCGGSQAEALVFWPTVGAAAFRFRLRGTDYAGTEQAWEQPLLFVEQACDPAAGLPSLADTVHLRIALDHYNASPRRVVTFAGESIAIAPSLRKGDTEIAVREITLKAIALKTNPADPCAAGHLAPDSEALKLHEDPCEPPFWPSVESIQASVPAVEAFLGASEPATWFPLSIDCNDAFEAFAELAGDKGTTASFHEKSDRSGGSLGPSPAITHLSRRFGPVGLGKNKGPQPINATAAAGAAPLAAAPNAPGLPTGKDFFADSASLFGTISLADIIGELSPDDGTVPALLSLLTPFADGPDFLQQSLSWETRSFKGFSIGEILAFEPKAETRFGIDGSFALWVGQPESASFSMKGELSNFAIRIGFTSAGARVNFNRVTYQALSDGRTSFDLELGEVEFLGALAFIQKLAERLREFLREELGVEVDLQPQGLTVWMPPINLPTLNFGMVTIKNLNIRSWVRLPFTPNPIELGFSFGRADAPCELSVGIFGGTAYALVLLDTHRGGIRRFEASLEFGVLREVSFGPAHGRVYLLGGIFFSVTMGDDGRIVVMRAFVRAGGSVDVLGLITAYIDLYIGLRHESNGARSFLVGEASLTIGFKIVLVKYSVTLRRTERLAGSASSSGRPESGFFFRRSTYASLEGGGADGCPPPQEPPPLTFEQAICEDDWIDYWAAFAPAEGAQHAA